MRDSLPFALALCPLPSALYLVTTMSFITAFLRRPPIGWWDLLDILVVSILIYVVL
jgi:hypothetical protein